MLISTERAYVCVCIQFFSSDELKRFFKKKPEILRGAQHLHVATRSTLYAFNYTSFCLNFLTVFSYYGNSVSPMMSAKKRTV